MRRLGHTIFIVRVAHHQLFAGASWTLVRSHRLPHQLHLHLHRVQRGEHLLHSLSILQRRISLQEVFHIQLNLSFLLIFCDCRLCTSSSSAAGVPPALPASFSNRQWLDQGGWWTLKAAHMKVRSHNDNCNVLFPPPFFG